MSNTDKYPDVPLITKEDEVVGQAQLSAIRKLGLPARVARVFLISNGAVLLQERSKEVSNPGVFDCSAEGWVDYEDVSIKNGERGDYEAAVVREAKEELDVNIAGDVKLLTRYLFKASGVDVSEWTGLYVVDYTESKHGTISPNNEVENVEWHGIERAYEWSRSKPQDFEPGAPLALEYLMRISVDLNV